MTEHHFPGLPDGGFRQGYMNGHLVTVKIRIEGRANQGVNLDGAAINEYRLEGLNAEPVQGRCPVEQYRALFNYFLQNIVDFRLGPLYQPAGALDIGG